MDTEHTTPSGRRRRWGTGSQRQVRPGVWEVRVPTGNNPDAGPSRRRSVTVHGTEAQATRARTALVAALTDPATLPPGVVLTVGELLTAWLDADHPWKPSTVVGYRSTVRALHRDPVARVRVLGLSPLVVRDLVDAWTAAGVTAAVAAARIRVIRSAVGWAWDERLIEVHPVRFLRGPGRVPPRRPLAEDDVRALLATAELRLLEAEANHRSLIGRGAARLHRAEQDLLLVRLAADTGARRGELAALQIADCTGRVLRIERAFSADVLTTPKSGHGRVLTLGASTAKLWQALAARWADRAGAPVGPWLFSADLTHREPVGAGALGHRFDIVRDAAGIPEATLHRLRHSVATFLVARGQVLQAQARLGHADAATTLREYAYALPLTDGPVADALEVHLTQHPTPPDQPRATPRDRRLGPVADAAQDESSGAIENRFHAFAWCFQVVPDEVRIRRSSGCASAR